jgi:hypothetical protein
VLRRPDHPVVGVGVAFAFIGNFAAVLAFSI